MIQDLINHFAQETIDESSFAHLSPFPILYLPSFQLCIHCIDLKSYSANTIDQYFFQNISLLLQSKQIHIVHLWEDVWLKKKSIVIDRLQSYCNKNKSLTAHITKLAFIDSIEAKNFIDTHHLFGHTPANAYLGLLYKGIVVSCALFGPPRYMKYEEPAYYSTELLRFVSIKGISVNGALSKLTSHYFLNYPTEEIMTYVDLDWSMGNSYTAIGYKIKEITQPLSFWLHPNTLERYKINRVPASIVQKGLSDDSKEKELVKLGFIKIYNAGNYKLILKKNSILSSNGVN